MAERKSRVRIAYDQSEPLASEIENSIRRRLNLMLEELVLGEDFLSVLFCSSETIRKLNAEYRATDKPTDILSWLYDEEEREVFEEEADLPWGELAVCLEVSLSQALDFGWSHEEEILRLLAHGLGHLAGYEHELSELEEAKALEFESKLLSLIGLDKIYS